MGIVSQIDAMGFKTKNHAAGAFPSTVLSRLEELLPSKLSASAETGCGKSTILFSNISKHHTVFCVDDTQEAESSIDFFKNCPLTKQKRVELVLGPTQITLPSYKKFKAYDAILIDGPHGFPYPEMEYYYFYPHLKQGAILILDDVHIATIGHLADFINEDPMFEFVDLISTTAVFRRTEAPTFNPYGDGWWLQNFNRRRIPADNKYQNKHRLDDGNMRQSFASLIARNARTQRVGHEKHKGLIKRLLGL